MAKAWIALVAAGLAMAAAHAEDPSVWLKVRKLEFAWWQKATPNSQTRISRLKARTAAQLKNHVSGAITDPPVVYRVIGAIDHLWDIPIAPRLTIIPAGEFSMGSAESEPGRQSVEGPQHRVTIPYPLAVGTYMVTRDEYAAFVADTLRPDPVGCYLTFRSGERGETPGYNWHNPGFEQSGNDPVVCVSWQDATAYADWLTKKTGERYRLLSEAEWEFASRGGTTTVRPWGDAITPNDANYSAGSSASPGDDGWPFTSPWGSFGANAFGIYDALGNAWQRLDDCWNPDFNGAPADGSVWRKGDCNQRTGHGGAFDSPPIYLRSAFRGKVPLDMHYADGGFRIAREL